MKKYIDDSSKYTIKEDLWKIWYTTWKTFKRCLPKIKKDIIGKIYHVSDPGRKDIENYFKKSI